MTNTTVVNGVQKELTGQQLLSSRASNNHNVICPSEDELQIEEGCECPVEGCCKHFKGSSQMQMHIMRHHKGLNLKELPKTVSNNVYCCPVNGCSRGKEKGRPFPRLGQLKQHYQAVHGKKDHICAKCGKRFALKDQCNRHEAECGQTFMCGTCSDSFRTKNGLYMHAKRKKHKLSEGIKPRKTTTSNSSVLKSQNVLHSSNLVKLLPTPIIIKQVIQLPKQVSISTQTSQTNSSFTSLKDSACQTDIEAHYGECTTTQTQTIFNFGHDHSNFNTVQSLQPLHVQPSSGMSTSQTMMQVQDSVTTQTESHHLPCLSADLLSLGTQTIDFTFTQGSQTQLTSSCEFGTQTMRYETPASTASSEVQCLQYDDLNTLDLVDFGTQTTIATDQLTNNNSDVSDFGTQTIFLPDFHSVESALSCSVDHDELHLLPPECMDFGTQTRECELNSIPSFDFGVQTALDLLTSSDTKDQGCQT